MGQIHVVVGGQFGSEGKGHVTAWLAKSLPSVDVVVRVAGPNAGHTAYDSEGRAFSLRQIPVAAVSNPIATLVIGAGSEIDPPVLAGEVRMLEEAGIPVTERLIVDPQATVITQVHKDTEQGGGVPGLVDRIGSTGKGIGAARADRIMRRAMTWDGYVTEEDVDETLLQLARGTTDMLLRSVLGNSGNIIIEGTQGYGLGLHAGYYPYCTSSDCRAIDFLSMAGITPSPANPLTVWPVFRTYPIRVAGNSGPMYRETTWEALTKASGGHIQPEKTTVTRKIRRVGEWDRLLAKHAMEANGGFSVCKPVLLFVDYWFPEMANKTHGDCISGAAWERISAVEDDLGQTLAAIGTGPDSVISFIGPHDPVVDR